MTKEQAKICPVCGAQAQAAYRPFCSRRCANVDLNRWLNESYRIPARPDVEETESPDEDDAPAGAGRNN